MTSFFSDYDNAVRPGFGKIMLSLNQSIFITCEGGGAGGAVLKDHMVFRGTKEGSVRI